MDVVRLKQLLTTSTRISFGHVKSRSRRKKLAVPTFSLGEYGWRSVATELGLDDGIRNLGGD